MVKTEFYRIREDGVTLVKTYSDRGMMIHGGYPEADYAEAIDVEGIGYTYTETDIPIPSEEITDEQAFSIIMGRGLPDDTDGSDDIPEDG